ncbi:hypothetical protein GCM10008909_19510 [Hathewaya limosa]
MATCKTDILITTHNKPVKRKYFISLLVNFIFLFFKILILGINNINPPIKNLKKLS